MAPALSKYLTSRTVINAGSLSVLLWLAHISRKARKSRNPATDSIRYVVGEKSSQSKGQKAHVDAEFAKQLRALWKIIVPGLFSPEAGFLALVAASLVARSLCDLWMIQNGTLIESAIIGADKAKFRVRLFNFLAAMPVISLVNNVLKYGITECKLRMRTRLTHHLYDQYLSGFTYYKMTNLDNRIANADQLLTVDVEKFCDTVVDLYSNISKPLLDIGIYVYRLTMNIGFKTPSVMMVYLLISGVILTHLRRPTGRLTMEEQRLEGEFRYINSRLITNSEEIAFYQGNRREKLTLLASYSKLITHLRKFLDFKFVMGVVDNIVARYIATVVGFWAVSIPFLTSSGALSKINQQERLQQYYTSGRMLVKLAEAIGRLVLAGREMSRLAGFTQRVTQLRQVLLDLNQGHYVRSMVSTNGMANGDGPHREGKLPLIPGAGRLVIQDKIIKFDRVPLVTPNGDVLIDELSFEVHSGMNVLVCGPNGCGKSSLFRMLGELWPLFGGTLTKPEKGKLFYIPQRPYMTLGTLRDQVIYPHTIEQMRMSGKTEADLERYLDRVQLSNILSREGGWDAIADWLDVLSGGEKQRIAMARLFYHEPQFAILDECTSAVSVDVEGLMYQYCREAGITLFTVSHRRSLWKHHEYYLQMDGRGSFEFKKIEENTEQFGS
ncbi:ATP-binding cassette sub-family D member 3 isoform X2 [Neocloeon triangulifer]|uniref:ATP-binding cassette sub-family D member 3 isoform X2 n=1 Tax=Neocloeon triangulifer TaxID=2078957 RepID=UPI00286FA7CC|nr:ATP-binding cassette sub-family D member 3 isoform X2 [Neocloeon triangulifer]